MCCLCFHSSGLRRVRWVRAAGARAPRVVAAAAGARRRDAHAGETHRPQLFVPPQRRVDHVLHPRRPRRGPRPPDPPGACLRSLRRRAEGGEDGALQAIRVRLVRVVGCRRGASGAASLGRHRHSPARGARACAQRTGHPGVDEAVHRGVGGVDAAAPLAAEA